MKIPDEKYRNDKNVRQNPTFFPKFNTGGALIRTGQKYEWPVQFCLFFVYFLCGSTNQRPPKFPGLSTFAKKRFMACPLASPYKRPPLLLKISKF